MTRIGGAPDLRAADVRRTFSSVTSDPSAAPVRTKVKKRGSLKCCARLATAPPRLEAGVVPGRPQCEFLQVQPPRDWEPLWLRQAREEDQLLSDLRPHHMRVDTSRSRSSMWDQIVMGLVLEEYFGDGKNSQSPQVQAT